MQLKHKIGLLGCAYAWFKNGGVAALPRLRESVSNMTSTFAHELAEDPAATLGKAYTLLMQRPFVSALLLYWLCRVLAHFFSRRVTAINSQQQEDATTTAAATSAPAAAVPTAKNEAKSAKKRK